MNQQETSEQVQSLELEKLAESTGLPPEKWKPVTQLYIPFLAIIQGVSDRARSINFTDPTEADCMLARKLRLELVPNRTGADKFKKDQKEEYARYNKLHDHSYGIIRTSSEILESKLEEVEKFHERLAQAKIAKISAERIERLRQYVDNPELFPVATMTDEAFEDLLNGQKLAKEAREKAEREAEEARIRAEQKQMVYNNRINALSPYVLIFDRVKELTPDTTEAEYEELLVGAKAAKSEADEKAEAQRQENERLKKEAEAKEKALEEERKRAEAERQRLEAEQAEQLRIEREAKEKAEAEIQARKDAEEKARIEAEKAAKKAASMPDREKVKAWVNSLNTAQFDITDPEVTILANEIVDKFRSFQKWALAKLESNG